MVDELLHLLVAEPAQIDLAENGGGDGLEGLEICRQPCAGFMVDHAEGPERVTARIDQRNAEVGDHAELPDRRVVA